MKTFPPKRPPSARRTWTRNLGALLCLTIAVVLPACGKKGYESAELPEPKIDGETVSFAKDAPQLASISVYPAQARTLAVTHATGRLYWNDDTTVRVYTPVGGRVVEINSDLGDKIEAGQPLAGIDSPDYGQALADARTSVGNLAAAEKTYAREKTLLEAGAAAAKDFEAAEAGYIAATAERDRAEARLANYGGNDKETKAVYKLKSPIGGVLVDKSINPGQELRADLMLANSPTLTNPNFVVSDPTKLWLQVDVAETDLPSLEVGQELRIVSKAYPGQVFTGKIDKVGATLDPLARTVKVRGVVDNPESLLRAEMYVLVDVLRKMDKVDSAGVEVSSKALFMKGRDYFLFVETTPDHFQRRQVKVGTEKDNLVPIFDGVKVGDNVVTDGCLLLQALVEPSS